MLTTDSTASTSNEIGGFDEDWFALYTRHQHERKVATHLEARGFTILCPTYSEVRQWRDRKKEITLPVFPGYVFIRGGLERQVSVLSTPGVHSIVCTGKTPAPIGKHEIDGIRRAVSHSISLEPAPFLLEGDRVRVVRGPLEGVEGIFQRRKDGIRLVISIEILGRSASLEILSDEVEPCTRPSFAAILYAASGDRASLQTQPRLTGEN
jgi:transcription antitermination factor NusG